MSVLWTVVKADAKWTAIAVVALLLVGWIGGMIADRVARRRVATQPLPLPPAAPPAPPANYRNGKKARS